MFIVLKCIFSQNKSVTLKNMRNSHRDLKLAYISVFFNTVLCNHIF